MLLRELEFDDLEVKHLSDKEALLLLLASFFWKWYYANKERKLTTIKVWFIRKTIYVKDLEGVFALIFGNST